MDSFSRPFHGLRREILWSPAMNRWAIVIRPLTRTETKTRFCAKPENLSALPSAPSSIPGCLWSFLRNTPRGQRTIDSDDVLA